MICLFLENLPTNASKTLLLAVAPPAQSKPLKLYDDTLELHVPRRNDNAPLGPHLRNAAWVKQNPKHYKVN